MEEYESSIDSAIKNFIKFTVIKQLKGFLTNTKCM
jgi:hypothetical protein